MNASVINFAAQRRTVFSMEYRVAAEVRGLFKAWPPHAVNTGIDAAQCALRNRASFFDALAAAGEAIHQFGKHYMPEAEVTRNAQRLTEFYQRRERYIAALMLHIDAEVCARMAGEPTNEIIAALDRAHRVLAGGGNYCVALCLAIGHGMSQARYPESTAC